MSSRTIARCSSLALLLWAGAASAQLCTGTTDPCVISTNQNVESGTVLDIGERGLVIAASKTLNVLDTGILAIFAGSLTLQDGAKIVANGANGFGGIVTVLTSGGVTMQPSSQIDVESGDGGSVDITAETGDVVMNGRINAQASKRQGLGGDVALTAIGGGVQVGGLGIVATGGDVLAGGGSILLDALGDVLIAGPITTIGSDGGTLDATAGGSITVAPDVEIRLNANDLEFGDGGDLCLEAGENVVLAGTVFSNGSGDGPENGGGDGGFIDLLAFGDIAITGEIEAKGSADGGGGALDLDAENLDVAGTIALTGPGQGDGGDVFLLATNQVFVRGTLDVRAGISGGSFSFGGSVDVISDGDIEVQSTAVLLTTGSYQAGTTDFYGCGVTVANGALIESLGPSTGVSSGVNHVQASGLATIGGVVKATTANRLGYREFAPVVTPQAGTSPAWDVVQNEALPCCIGCPTTTTTSTSTSTSSSVTTTTSTSSTSTTSSSTTTTTMAGTTSTTSTTIVPTTTSTIATTTTSSLTTTTSSMPATTSTVVSTTSSSTTSTIGTTTSTIVSTTTTLESSTSTTTLITSTTTLITTTTTLEPGTTTTTLPPTCVEQSLQGFEAAACALGVLDEDVTALGDDDLGGRRPARGLRKRITKSVEFLDRASVETKVKKARRFVKRSRKKLASFEKKVVRFGSKGKIVLTTAESLLDSAERARIRIEAIETELSQQ